jgi:hypothetical protein
LQRLNVSTFPPAPQPGRLPHKPAATLVAVVIDEN